MAAPAADLARKPNGIDHASAAAAPMALLTAWQFLVELGHDAPNPFQPLPHRPLPLAGRKVVAIASGAHESFLRDIGADEFIDYTKAGAADLPHDVDVVLDTVGGPGTGRFLAMLKPGGALFPVYPLGFTGAADATKAGYTVSTTQVRSNGAQLAQAARLLDEGKVRVAIDSRFSLADARRAHERAAGGHRRGKIVLTVTEAA